MNYTIKYRRAKITLDTDPRKGHCEVCPNEGKTDTHHWRYQFPTSEVRKKPELALRNTAELCFPHHRLANALKMIAEAKPEMLVALIKTMDDETYFQFSDNISIIDELEWAEVTESEESEQTVQQH